MSNSDYYRRRAVCRKILAEGTGLQPDRMTTTAINDRLRSHISMLTALMGTASIADPPLARAIVELDALYTELFMRGVQITLPI